MLKKFLLAVLFGILGVSGYKVNNVFNSKNYVECSKIPTNPRYFLKYELETPTLSDAASAFIEYWNQYIITDKNISICDINEFLSNEAINKYNALSDDDKKSINNLKDLSGNELKEQIKQLKINLKPIEQIKEKEISQTTMIIFILSVAITGMTFICVFYILKSKNVIE